MTIISQGEFEFEFECDECGHRSYQQEPDFSQAVYMLKREGWKIVRVGGGWEHHCPACR